MVDIRRRQQCELACGEADFAERKYLGAWERCVDRGYGPDVVDDGAHVGVAEPGVIVRRHDQQLATSAVDAVADGAQHVGIRVTRADTTATSSEIGRDDAAESALVENDSTRKVRPVAVDAQRDSARQVLPAMSRREIHRHCH